MWCLGPESNRHAPVTEATDFKSGVSTSFTTEAGALLFPDKEGFPLSADL